MSNHTLRILTAAAGLPIVIGLTYLGGWPFVLLLLAAALLAQYELYGILSAAGLPTMRTAGLAIGALMVLRVMWPWALPLALALVILLVASAPFFRRGEETPALLSATAFGILYPATFLSLLADLRLGLRLPLADDEAFWLTLAVLVLIWTTDTFAYFVGRSLGRRPLAPAVSPKKTWEGTIGGAAGALLVAAVLRVTVLDFLAWGHIIAIALICGIVSQLGDLAESRLKRVAGVKDSGAILPGHGGVLDRLDALIVAGPLVYLYLVFFIAAVIG